MSLRPSWPPLGLVVILSLNSACNLLAGAPCQRRSECKANEQCVAGFCVVSDGPDTPDTPGTPGTPGWPNASDAGTAVQPAVDAGFTPIDAGVTPSDAGSPSRDAGASADGGVSHENNFCDDGIDNDGDQRMDCLDTDCTNAPGCEPCSQFTTASGVYLHCGQRFSLVAAENRCAEQGARLVSIETIEEQAALAPFLRGHLSWLGITDVLVEGEYRSRTFPFRPPSELPFADGQPDNGVIRVEAGARFYAGAEVDGGSVVALDGGEAHSDDGASGQSDGGDHDAGTGDASTATPETGDGGDAAFGVHDSGSSDAGWRDGGDAGDITPTLWPFASGSEEDCLVTSDSAWADVPCDGVEPFEVYCEIPMRRWSVHPTFDRPELDLSEFSITAAPDGSVVLFGGREGAAQTRSAKGLRLNLATSSFAELPAPPPALLARTGHVAAHLGEQFVVWGGETDFGATAHGARLVSTTSQWIDLPALSAPSAATGACGIALGNDLFVFGGKTADSQGRESYVNDGGLYLLDEDRWLSLPDDGLPTARAGHVCVGLDAHRVFVWGGMGARQDAVGLPNGTSMGVATLDTGAIYHRTTHSWTPLSLQNAPSARADATAIAIENKVIVFGGRTLGFPYREWQTIAGGARFDLENQTWEPLSMLDAPSPRYGARAWVIGDEALIFGGKINLYPLGEPPVTQTLSGGGLFRALENRWRSVNNRDAPTAVLPLSAWGNSIVFWAGRADESLFRYVPGIPAIDRDDDGLTDAHESYLGSDPDDPDSNDDAIADGDAIEEQLPFLP